MIQFLAAWAVKRGLARTAEAAKPFIKVGLVVLAVVLLIGGFLLWDHLDDKAAVQQADAARQRDEAVQTLDSERRANAGDQVRAEARAEASQQTRDELETIHAEEPEAAAAPASRGTRAVAGRLPGS